MLLIKKFNLPTTVSHQACKTLRIGVPLVNCACYVTQGGLFDRLAVHQGDEKLERDRGNDRKPHTPPDDDVIVLRKLPVSREWLALGGMSLRSVRLDNVRQAIKSSMSISEHKDQGLRMHEAKYGDLRQRLKGVRDACSCAACVSTVSGKLLNQMYLAV